MQNSYQKWISRGYYHEMSHVATVAIITMCFSRAWPRARRLQVLARGRQETGAGESGDQGRKLIHLQQ